jgi:opacity protein-like surface antigen
MIKIKSFTVGLPVTELKRAVEWYRQPLGEVEEVNTRHGTFSTGGGHNHSDLAWQVIAGTDYYWTPKWSTFIEYHYLDYTSTQIDTAHGRDLGQDLVGAGVRFHF